MKEDRKECLEKAIQTTCEDRNDEYGEPEKVFETISCFWANYLEAPISPLDVANMMILLKIARSKSGPTHLDNYIDMAGYAACAFEEVTSWEER